MNKVLAEYDAFAPSVEFTFKEKRRHGTPIGGCCTIAATFCIMYLSVSSLYRICHMSHYQIASS